MKGPSRVPKLSVSGSQTSVHVQKVIDLALVVPHVPKETETPKYSVTSKFNPNETPPPKSASSKMRINLSETRVSFNRKEVRPPLASG